MGIFDLFKNKEELRNSPWLTIESSEDLDKVVESGFVNAKSTIIEVASGFDDIVGQYIFEELFFSKDTLEIPFDEEAESVE